MKFMLTLAVVAVFACGVYATEEAQSVEPQPEGAKRDKRGFLAAAPLAAPLAYPAPYAALPAPYAAYHAAPYAAYHAAPALAYTSPLAYSAPYVAAAPYAKAIAAPALAGYTVLG